jgi:hypothetical protein
MAISFHDIVLRRPALARQYLADLEAQPGRPLSMFAPRQTGKTFFLTEDLTPLARDAGYLVVYVDVWLNRSAPLEAINHGLEEALDSLRLPATEIGKVAKTEVKKVAVLGTSIELGNAPERRPLPEKPGLRLDSLLRRINADYGKIVLLLLDEFQALGESDDSHGTAVVSALRAVLQQHKAFVSAVFTGSSQDELGAMFASAGAPMFQFAQQVSFPYLGDEWAVELQAHYRQVHRGREPSLVDLQRLFAAVDYRPKVLKDIVVQMSADGVTDVDRGLARYLSDDANTGMWKSQLERLRYPIDRAMLFLMAQGMKPVSEEAGIRLTAMLLAPKKITQGQARMSVDRLRKSGVISKSSGEYRFSDSMFRKYLQAETWDPFPGSSVTL